MIGERENFSSEANYGMLVMRPYNIDGNEINAFYDSSDNLVFVMDNTIKTNKPNVLLVINPEGDKKWDEILSGVYHVDLETIRPKHDNKYQKLDIEYSGLSVYDDLIRAYNSGDSLEEALKQLFVLRDSAARHSAMMRLNAANEIITKTNTTIVKTKESIVRLQARLKTLRAKLAEVKKGIGRVPTKQSAAKILKLEAQIEATNEKLKRAQERLKSAQRRLETATVDAELASNLLNQSGEEPKEKTNKTPSQPLVIASKNAVIKAEPENQTSVPQIVEDVFVEEVKEEPEHEDVHDVVEKSEDTTEQESKNDNDKDDDMKKDIDDKEKEVSEVEPLFSEDPQILNEDIAFKPISFEAPVVPELPQDKPVPALDHDMILTEETKEETTIEEPVSEKPVLESMVPIEASSQSVPEYVPLGEITEEETLKQEDEEVKEEPLEIESVAEEVRQPEPVIEEKTEEITVKTEEEKPEEIPFVRPVPPMPSSPYIASNGAITHETERSKPTFVYYLLLIVLIVLAVFTLWLYQKNVKPSAPVLTTTVEKTEPQAKQTTVFKKTSKAAKKANIAKDDIDSLPVFLDEEPAQKQIVTEPEQNVDVVTEEIAEQQDVEEVIIETSTPEVIDAVPARVNTSGQSVEDTSSRLSEEEILANKPIYEPGPKHDEMFVSEADVDEAEYIEYVEDINQPVEYVESDVIYEPEEDIIEYIEEDDPYFDAEEAEYQAEQEMYYEE